MIAKFKDSYVRVVTVCKKPLHLAGSLKEVFKSKVIRVFPEKNTINLGAVLAWSGALFLSVVTLSSLLFSPEDVGSYYNTVYSANSSRNHGDAEATAEKSQEDSSELKGVKGAGQRLSGDDPPLQDGPRSRGPSLKYRGTQVLVRSGGQGAVSYTHLTLPTKA